MKIRQWLSTVISSLPYPTEYFQEENSKIASCNHSTEPKSGVDSVERFFARLMQQHHWTEQGKVNSVLDHLRRQEINTVMVLKEMWEEVKSDLPLSMGMKKVLEQEMGRI